MAKPHIRERESWISSVYLGQIIMKDMANRHLHRIHLFSRFYVAGPQLMVNLFVWGSVAWQGYTQSSIFFTKKGIPRIQPTNEPIVEAQIYTRNPCGFGFWLPTSGRPNNHRKKSPATPAAGLGLASASAKPSCASHLEVPPNGGEFGGKDEG